LQVLSQAISILQKAEAERTAAETAELERLLGTLNIGPTPRAPARAGTAPKAAAAAAASNPGQMQE
jgi:hypothetical protein